MELKITHSIIIFLSILLCMFFTFSMYSGFGNAVTNPLLAVLGAIFTILLSIYFVKIIQRFKTL